MNAFRPLSKQPWVVAGKQQRNRLGQAHTLSWGVGLYSFSDTIPVRLNRLLKCPLAVACVCPRRSRWEDPLNLSSMGETRAI
jgi:hypothetical protein